MGFIEQAERGRGWEIRLSTLRAMTGLCLHTYPNIELFGSEWELFKVIDRPGWVRLSERTQTQRERVI